MCGLQKICITNCLNASELATSHADNVKVRKLAVPQWFLLRGSETMTQPGLLSWIYAAAAADAVYVFKEQKTELLLKVTEKPLRHRDDG